MKKNKIFKHKWWQHLFLKYKVVETEFQYREYCKIRNWVSISIFILAIILFPITGIVFTLYEIITKGKILFSWDDGKDGSESFSYIWKVDLEDDENEPNS